MKSWESMDPITLRVKANQGNPDAKGEQRRRLSCLQGAVIPAWELLVRPKLPREIESAVRACR